MTKKDYELFANEIHSLRNVFAPSEMSLVVSMCSKVFGDDNCNFQYKKFAEACREGKHIRKSIKG